MNEESEREAMVEHVWRTYLTTGEFVKEARQRRLFRMLPGNPRCKNCYVPFSGVSSRLVRFVYGKRPSNLNPQMCNECEKFAREYQGGAEVELSLLFADVRGSTALAETMSPTEFSRLINRFYKKATEVMVHSDALIDKIIGDQVAGMYVPGFVGPAHARKAIEAAQEILRVTGHGTLEGPWISLGAGVHTGIAFVGAMGSDQGTTDITVLGDTANTAARISTSAGVGEILISEAAYTNAGLQLDALEHRKLELKGKIEPFPVYVLTDYATGVLGHPG
ncbi:MAG TPA: adenylate/guanylate cyclase domain-containing protein [Patescibacteria group bacterium]|nr:adenylate/guanylate cyclase domain-containing protein [Patescibacteria group bacterium]